MRVSLHSQNNSRLDGYLCHEIICLPYGSLTMIAIHFILKQDIKPDRLKNICTNKQTTGATNICLHHSMGDIIHHISRVDSHIKDLHTCKE